MKSFHIDIDDPATCFYKDKDRRHMAEVGDEVALVVGADGSTLICEFTILKEDEMGRQYLHCFGCMYF